MFLHAIFDRVIIDQVLIVNLCGHAVLMMFVKRPSKAITPEQFEDLLGENHVRHFFSK